MKPRLLFVPVLAMSGMASAQSTTATSMRDINGNRVTTQSSTASKTATDSERTQLSQSVNGRQVPLEQTVDHVIREDANGKVTERIVKKFNRDGQVAATERVMIEESKLAGGASTIRETTYRSDLNGGMREAERKVTETRVNGSTTTANTTIDRPTLNGSMETVEKRSAVAEGPADNQRTTESVYRRNPSGGFQEAQRTVKTASKANDTTKETTAQYEPGMNGQLQVSAQTESVATKQADGTETIQTNLFTATVAGKLQDNTAAMRVKEQQLVQRKTNPDGSVVETLSVRRPSVSDPSRLGDLQKVSETVCTGKCLPDPAKPAADTTAKAAAGSAPGNSRP